LRFEKKHFQGFIRNSFVGHPFFDFSVLKINKLNHSNKKYFTLCPGSRVSELETFMPIFIEVIKKINLDRNIKSKISLVKDRPGHDLRYCLNSSKIQNRLNWKCKSDFNQRINDTVVWYIDKFGTNYFKNQSFKYRTGLKI
jgi:dTDP-D-glucose 4,6-dehydratase